VFFPNCKRGLFGRNAKQKNKIKDDRCVVAIDERKT
jgi:hypothetical protein